MSTAFLRFLTEEDLGRLLANAQRTFYRRGQALLEEGGHRHDLLILRKGFVRVERREHGTGVALARLGPDQVLNEIGFLEETPASASLIAEGDVEADVVDAAHVRSLLASDTGFSARFFQSLAVALADRLRLASRVLLQRHAREELRHQHARLPRTGQITEVQVPAELPAAVAEFKTALQQIVAQLKAGSLSGADAQAPVSAACDALVAALNHLTQPEALLEIGYDDPLAFRDPAQLAVGVGGYIFRETFPFLMGSATIARCYMQPTGCAEDRETLELIYRNEPEGDGPLGPYLDRWFLGRPLCRSRRNSRRLMAGLLEQAATAASPGPVPVTSLAAGTADELFDLLSETHLPLAATCIDSDLDALRHGSGRARELGLAEHLTFVHGNVVAMAHGRGLVSLGPQQLIYGLGLGDYLTDDQLLALLNWAFEHLRTGGSVVLTNLDAANPDRAFMEHLLDWRAIHRTAGGVRELFARSRFKDLPVEIKAEEAGVNLFVVCGKK